MSEDDLRLVLTVATTTNGFLLGVIFIMALRLRAALRTGRALWVILHRAMQRGVFFSPYDRAIYMLARKDL